MKEKYLPIALPDNVLTLTFISVGFFSFAVPFSLGHPQIVVGALVNAALLLGALYFPNKLVYPLIFFPSLGVLSRGIIFGPLTPFLIMMIPFIWLGNWLLVFSFRSLINQGKTYLISLAASALLKSVFLSSASLVLFKIGLLPKLLLGPMGAVQLVTAVSGGVLSYFVKKFYSKYF